VREMNNYRSLMILFIVLLFSSVSPASYSHSIWWAKSFGECDETLKTVEDKSEFCNMICRDHQIHQWRLCWEKSQKSKFEVWSNSLKKTNPEHFLIEKKRNKEFLKGTEVMCGKSCSGGGSGMRGISYNFCRTNAYKYRINQIDAMQVKNFDIPSRQAFPLRKIRKKKNKESQHYKTYLNNLCKLPNIFWKNKKIPKDCESKAFEELNSFEFTDDLCDLS